MKLYFGHPIDTYDTPLETELIQKIQDFFPFYFVENPNQPHHQIGYKIYKQETGNGMTYYYENVLPDMNAGVFLPFEDGMFGAGVWAEANFLHELAKPIYEINLEGKISKLELDENRELSIQETRDRLYS